MQWSEMHDNGTKTEFRCWAGNGIILTFYPQYNQLYMMNYNFDRCIYKNNSVKNFKQSEYLCKEYLFNVV